MSEAQAIDRPQRPADWASAAANRRVRRRYAADRRLQAYGIIAIGLAVEWLQGTVRLSLGSDNTLAEVETFLQMLPPIVARLRQHAGGSIRRTTSTPSTTQHRA